jgi:hypothetical protein
MNKTILLVLLPVLFLSSSLMAASVSEPNVTVLNYFQALKQGDIETIKKYIAGEFYKKKKILLEKNTEYPEFLRKHYNNVGVRTIGTNLDGSEATVEVELSFPNGEINFIEMYLELTSQDLWKIYRERLVVK